MRTLYAPLAVLLLATWAASARAADSSSAPDAAYIHSFEKWKAAETDDLKTNWLPLVGLFWLKPGINAFGSDPSNAIVFPKGPGHAGEFDLDGKDVTLAQYKGKVVLVNFWATWCGPCRVEIPWLIEFQQKYGPRGFTVLGVAMDDDGKKAVEPWVKKERFEINGQPAAMNYPILLGNDALAEKFGGIIGLPTSMLISRDGKKVKTIVGLVNHADMVKAIESQL